MKVFQGKSHNGGQVHSGAKDRTDKGKRVEPDIKGLLDVLAEGLAIAFLSKANMEEEIVHRQ